MKQRVWLGLFGLVFALAFGAGAWFGGWTTLIETASSWVQARSWKPVQARVTYAELRQYHGDTGTTYSVGARYVYRYAGREYEGQRVGLHSEGSDNFDDWHQGWFNTLRNARDSERPVEAWVDHDHPERAVLDRQVRLPTLMFALSFAVGFTLFSALGCLLLWVAFRKPDENALPLANLGRIQRSAGGAWGTIIVGIVFLSLGIPAAYVVAMKFRTLHLSWFVLLFPLIGAWLCYAGVKGLGEARRLGKVSLQLIDLRPALGESMRGAIEFEGDPGAKPCAVRLFCERVDTHGEDTDYDRLWVKEVEVRPIGKRVSFSFDLPTDMPPSEPDAKVYHRWCLQLRSEELAQLIDFELTVYAPEKSVSDAAPQDAAEGNDATRIDSPRHDAPIPAAIATVTSGLRRLCIDYNTALHRSTTWICGVMALIFGGVGFTLVFSRTSFFGMVFVLMGAGLLYVGLRCVWVRRCVTVAAGQLTVEDANIFSKKTLSFPVQEIAHLIPTVTYSKGAGSSQTDYYTLNAVTRNGECINVGSGIDSPRVVESLLNQLRRALGEHVCVASVERAYANRFELAKLNTQPQSWGMRNARKLFLGFVFFAAALSFGGFALDFYRDINGYNGRPSSSSGAAARIAATPDAWFAAMDADRLEDLKAIAALGFDINTQAENGSSALALAASKGRLEIAKWLIESGADIHQRNGQKKNDNYLTTPLMRAGFGANPKLVALLLDRGADIRAEDHFKRTPLHFMAWGGCGECIRMVVKKGADLEAQATGNRGETPLMSAAGGGHVEGVRTLLQLGAYSKAQDSYGYTALGWAQFHQHPKIVELLESAP